MAKKKTWKIGEYAKGGIITVEITGKDIAVIGKEWDYSKGSSKGSDQSNAKEFTRKTLNAESRNVNTDLFMFLTDLTTSYYADQVITWIKANVKLEANYLW